MDKRRIRATTQRRGHRSLRGFTAHAARPTATHPGPAASDNARAGDAALQAPQVLPHHQPRRGNERPRVHRVVVHVGAGLADWCDDVTGAPVNVSCAVAVQCSAGSSLVLVSVPTSESSTSAMPRLENTRSGPEKVVLLAASAL